MAKEKKEIKINYRKDVNEAWCGSAYFVNRVTKKTYCISVAAMPGEKARTAKAWVKEELERAAASFVNKDPSWERVDKEACDEFEKTCR